MKRSLFTLPLSLLFYITTHAQAVYVDCIAGNDKNSGTKESPVYSIHKAAEIIRSSNNDIYVMRINPGIYVLENHVSVATEKDMTNKRIRIEANYLPDDTSWTPEKIPVIVNKSLKGEIPDLYHWVVSFLIDESHVTIRGIKFHGYFQPNSRYFPIARINKSKRDLLVEQCMFTGEGDNSPIQAGVIAIGNEVKIDHCVFYKTRNTVVFFLDAGDGIKYGNGITNSIIYGVSQAVWTVSPDKDFIFENNIISNCRYVWVRNSINKTKYSINNCIITNNRFYTGVPDTQRLYPAEFEISENNVKKQGNVSLRLIDDTDKPLLFGIDQPLPVDYLHVIPGSTGYEFGAGLFKTKKL